MNDLTGGNKPQPVTNLTLLFLNIYNRFIKFNTKLIILTKKNKTLL